MKKVLYFLLIFVTAGLLLWAFPFIIVAIGAPTQVDLVLTKSDSPDPVFAGNLLTYTLAVTNSGTTRASNVVLTDTLPGGVSFNAASGCTYNAGLVRCDLPTLNSGHSASRTITVRVSPSARGSLSNTAVVTSLEPDPITSTNTAQATTNINASAALGLNKSDGVSQVTAGGGVTHAYAITVTNGGPSLASGVVVTDTWPVSFTRGTVSRSQGTCNTGSPTNFTCAVGNIQVGGRQTITVTYSVQPGAPSGSYTNMVRANSLDATAPVTATDVNSVVAAIANLGIAKDDGVSQVAAGDGMTHTYAITVTNSGPSLATGVVVTDTWPAGITRGVVRRSQGTCDTSTSPTNFTCNVGDILVGGRQTITATYSVPLGVPAGTYTNTATVRSAEASAPVLVRHTSSVLAAAADLGIAKSDGLSQVVAGGGATHSYAITVTNTGNSLASGVVVTDTWPVSFTRGTVSWSQGSCNTASPTNFTCAVGNIQVGGRQTITATYSVPPGAPAGVYTNTAVVNSVDATALVTATDRTSVSTQANLTISKLDNPDPINSGEILTYTISVTDNGPSNARGVVLTDSLPNGTTLSSPVPPGCTATGSLVTCSLGEIAAGSSRQVVLKALVSTLVGGPIHNVANVTASTIDPVPGNNQATADTLVDVGNPVVNWLLPVMNEGYYSVNCIPVCQTVHFEVTASDTVGVQKVVFKRWDHVSLVWIPITTDNSSPYTWEFNTSVLPFGTNQIWVWAYDALNHESAGKRIFLYKPRYIYLPVMTK